MTTVPFRTPNRCGTCGAEWYDTHACPNAPRSTSAPQIVDVVRQVQLGEAASTPVCGCGLPMSRNPHPDAGKPNQAGVEVGYVWECIPCLVKTRNRVGRDWRAAQARIQAARERHQPVEEEAEFYFHDENGPSEHCEAHCTYATCAGHDAKVKVCRECGYGHDGDSAVYRPWPCPTVEALGGGSNERS